MDEPLFIARETLKGIPQQLSRQVGQPALRAYAALGGFLTRRPLTPSTPFQRDLYGTNKPITLGGVGSEQFGVSPKSRFAPVLGAFAGIADAIPGGKPEKSLLKTGIRAEEAVAEKAPKIFKGFTDLSTKILEKLRGRTTVSKQFISDLTNAPDLKQPERDLIRNVLQGEGNDVKVTDFANKVKTELLPLERTSATAKDKVSGVNRNVTNYAPRYENIALPDELRGPVANYDEHIYNSPIQTSAGGVHFSGKEKNYFAHTRIEDLPGETMRISDAMKRGDATNLKNFEAGLPMGTQGSTRRVIELQSDLFQKGRLELENNRLEPELIDYTSGKRKVTPQHRVDRTAELSKLEPYRNTWHERVIREEVKQAAKDGKKILQFPTGETAMKIEGLGENASWADISHHVDGDEAILASPGDLLSSNQLKVGQRVARVDEGIGSFDPEDSWIITDVLGDGKFRAVPKDEFEKQIGLAQEALNMSKAEAVKSTLREANAGGVRSESIDISGKVDTDNPIYKFYEKEVGRYLKNKYNAQLVTDERGVSWWQMNVSPDAKKLPIEAFGALALPSLSGNVQDNEQRRPFPRSQLFLNGN